MQGNDQLSIAQAKIDRVQFAAKPNGDEPDFDAFPCAQLDEIAEDDAADIVQSLYGSSSVVALVGPPNAGKTALGVDHGLSIAAGQQWFGLKVCGGPVIYFAPEARASVIMRAKAARRAKFPAQRLPFYVARGTPQLGGEHTSIADAERMLATIRAVSSAEGEHVKLVQIDTLASCLGNGDENGDGMIRIVAAAKYIGATIGCAVMLIHHPSKADSAGLRGHGSLAAACDTIITIAEDGVSGTRTATLVKSRDTATGTQFSYTLESVILPNPDSFGDPRTTIVVKPAMVTIAARRRPAGKRQDTLLAELERRHRIGETGWSEAVIREIGRTLGMPSQSARDALKGLEHAGYVWGQAAHLTLKYPPKDSTK